LIQGFHFQITLLMKLPEKENVLFWILLVALKFFLELLVPRPWWWHRSQIWSMAFKNVPVGFLGTRYTIAISFFKPGPQELYREIFKHRWL
jgi:hypothetical protein